MIVRPNVFKFFPGGDQFTCRDDAETLEKQRPDGKHIRHRWIEAEFIYDKVGFCYSVWKVIQKLEWPEPVPGKENASKCRLEDEVLAQRCVTQEDMMYWSDSNYSPKPLVDQILSRVMLGLSKNLISGDAAGQLVYDLYWCLFFCADGQYQWHDDGLVATFFPVHYARVKATLCKS